MAKYVECDGYIWKLTNKAYNQLIKDIQAEKDIDLDKVGKLICDSQVEKLYDLQRDNS